MDGGKLTQYNDLACTCPHQDHGATVCTKSLTNIIQSSFRWQQDTTNTMASNLAGFLLWGAHIRHTRSPHKSSCCCQTQLPCGQQCQCQHIRWSQSQSAIALGHGSQPQHLYKTHRLGCRGCNWLWSCRSLTYTFSSSPAPALLQHAQTPSQTYAWLLHTQEWSSTKSGPCLCEPGLRLELLPHFSYFTQPQCEWWRAGGIVKKFLAFIFRQVLMLASYS